MKRKYQTYKSSGVDWIGDVPSVWRISKFKYVSKLYTGNSLNDEQKVLYESDNENDIPYVSSKDIDLNTQTVNYFNGLRIPRDNNPLKVSPKDSFLLCVEGGSSGRKMVYLDREVCFVNKLCSFQSIENTRYQYYFIQSSNFQDKFKLSLSGLIGGVSISTLRDFELILPPLHEQHQIVQFLDSKTELIDKLISTKERKITLLKEQKTSLINQVITKGLNPNVKTKDSGVVWVGEIPESWNNSKIKYQFSFKGGGTPSTENDLYWNGDILWVSPKDMKSKFINDTQDKITQLGLENSSSNLVPPNSLLIVVRSGILQRTIPVSINTHDVSLNQDIKSIQSKGNLLIEFLYYFIKGNESNLLLEWSKVGCTVESIEMDYLYNFPISFPEMNEQIEIVKHLDSKTKEIDDMVQLEQKKIDLLKEYRQSLISEVVTGKIKVTN